MRPWRLVPASVLALLLLASAPARAALVAVPPAVRFGVVGPGQLSSAVIVTILNNGPGQATINNSLLAGPNPGDFLLDFGVFQPPFAIGPGVNFTIAVRFSPQSKGQKRADLTVGSNGNNVVVPVSGTCGTTLPAADPLRVDFGGQRVQVGSAPVTLNLTNVGAIDTYRVTAIRVSGPHKDWFHPGAMIALPLVVAPNARVPLDLTALPLAAGPGGGLLELDTDDAVTPLISVPLSATGTAPAVTLDPPLGAFGTIGVQDKKTILFALRNSGDDVLHLEDFRFNAGNGVFQVADAPMKDGNGAWPSLNPGANLLFRVVFCPPVQGQYANEVAIDTDAPGQRHLLIPLTGSGDVIGLRVNPPVLDFGIQLPGGQSPAGKLTLTNLGGAPLIGIRVTVSGANPNQFRFEDPGTFDLTGGGSKIVPVYYAPLSAGQHSALLIITPAGFPPVQARLLGNAPASTATVEIETGQIPATTLDFDRLDKPNDLFEETDPQPVRIRPPVGGVGVRIERIAVAGSGAFRVTLPSDPDLKPGIWNTFTVSFSPTVENRTEVAAADVYAAGIAAPIATVKLTGTGVRRIPAPLPATSGCSVTGRSTAAALPSMLLAAAAALALRRRVRRTGRRGSR